MEAKPYQKYEHSKIYKIVCDETNKIFIGSTVQKYLSSRLSQYRLLHKNYKNNQSRNYKEVFEVLENDSYHIELIEKYPCKNKLQLRRREKVYVDSVKCVNKIDIIQI